MFLGRIRSTATAGIAADSPDRRQRPLDDRPYLRQRPNQLFLLFLYGGIVFHNAIKYNSFMALSSEGATSLDTTARASLIRTISRQATRILNLEEENQELKNLVKALKDEIRRLKGEKGRPALKPSLPDQPGEEKKPRRTGNWKKSGKTITVTRTERLSIKPAVLPADARYKGTRRVIIQDLRIEPDNVAFEIERSHISHFFESLFG
jgi:transposase